MKIILKLPDELGRKFKERIPNSQRSKLLAELLSKRLRTEDRSLEHAAKKANEFKNLIEDMKAWEGLSEARTSSGVRIFFRVSSHRPTRRARNR